MCRGLRPPRTRQRQCSVAPDGQHRIHTGCVSPISTPSKKDFLASIKNVHMHGRQAMAGGRSMRAFVDDVTASYASRVTNMRSFVAVDTFKEALFAWLCRYSVDPRKPCVYVQEQDEDHAVFLNNYAAVCASTNRVCFSVMPRRRQYNISHPPTSPSGSLHLIGLDILPAPQRTEPSFPCTCNTRQCEKKE